MLLLVSYRVVAVGNFVCPLDKERETYASKKWKSVLLGTVVVAMLSRHCRNHKRLLVGLLPIVGIMAARHATRSAILAVVGTEDIIPVERGRMVAADTMPEVGVAVAAISGCYSSCYTNYSPCNQVASCCGTTTAPAMPSSSGMPTQPKAGAPMPPCPATPPEPGMMPGP